MRPGAFLTIGMVFLLWVCGLAPNLCHRGKRPARSVVPQGGSDPTKLLGGSAAKKWGRSRPIWTFFHGDFLPFASRISPASKDFGVSEGEEVGNFRGAERNSYVLHPTAAAFTSPAGIRLMRNVANSTLRSRLSV